MAQVCSNGASVMVGGDHFLLARYTCQKEYHWLQCISVAVGAWHRGLSTHYLIRNIVVMPAEIWKVVVITRHFRILVLPMMIFFP